MALPLGNTVINCQDLELMTVFWSRALGLRPGPVTEGGAFRVLGGDHVNNCCRSAVPPVTARDQMHLHLYTSDKAQEVERLVALGAICILSSGNPDDDYDVLRDPEGNNSVFASSPSNPQGDGWRQRPAQPTRFRSACPRHRVVPTFWRGVRCPARSMRSRVGRPPFSWPFGCLGSREKARGVRVPLRATAAGPGAGGAGARYLARQHRWLRSAVPVRVGANEPHSGSQREHPHLGLLQGEVAKSGEPC